MNTEQARKLVNLHDNADRALLNLRNANSMATDDPRAPELLSEAGDAYAEAQAALIDEQAVVVQPHMKASVTIADREDGPPSDAEVFEPGTAAWIVDGGDGAGFVTEFGDNPEGNVAIRLTTDGRFGDDEFAEGTTVTVPAICLSPTQPEGAPDVVLPLPDGSQQGQAPATS